VVKCVSGQKAPQPLLKSPKQHRVFELVLQELKAKHNIVLAQFKEAQAEHTKEVALKQEREQHAHAAAEAAEARRLKEERENQAAARIQAQWRGYKTRQGAKGGKDKGKKGKKKK
jgi:hypothetical protein